jgi:hypothetical protein
MKNVKEFYEMMDKLPKTTPLTRDESGLMVACLMEDKLGKMPSEADQEKEEYKEFWDGGMFEMARVILTKRSAGHGIAVFFTYGVIALLMAVTNGSPGNLVMYMAYLANWSNAHDTETIDINVFANIFAMGTFSEADLQKAWETQKVRDKEFGDNLLDRQSFWKIKA